MPRALAGKHIHNVDYHVKMAKMHKIWIKYRNNLVCSEFFYRCCNGAETRAAITHYQQPSQTRIHFPLGSYFQKL